MLNTEPVWSTTLSTCHACMHAKQRQTPHIQRLAANASEMANKHASWMRLMDLSGVLLHRANWRCTHTYNIKWLTSTGWTGNSWCWFSSGSVFMLAMDARPYCRLKSNMQSCMRCKPRCPSLANVSRCTNISLFRWHFIGPNTWPDMLYLLDMSMDLVIGIVLRYWKDTIQFGENTADDDVYWTLYSTVCFSMSRTNPHLRVCMSTMLMG